MKHFLILLAFIILFSSFAFANHYEVSLNYIMHNDSLCSTAQLSETDGFYIYENVVVDQIPSLEPFYFYQSFKYRKNNIKSEDLPNLFLKDSIDRALEMRGKSSYYSQELMDLQEKYQRNKYKWIIYFFEKEVYDNKIYQVVKIKRYKYNSSKQYDPTRIPWPDNEIILYFEFDINMQQILDVWHLG